MLKDKEVKKCTLKKCGRNIANTSVLSKMTKRRLKYFPFSSSPTHPTPYLVFFVPSLYSGVTY